MSATYYEKRREVRAHADLFEQIASTALTPEGTRDRLATLGGLRSGD
ncbi:hypothetical protein ACQPZF_02780 [Actinosynnema sp. CS-041913]